MLALAGCTTQPATTASVDTSGLEARAEREAELGNLDAAAQIYRQLADGSRGAAQAGHLISGARLLVEREDFARAGAWLGEARNAGTPEQQQVVTALLAQIEVGQGRAESALRMVGTIQSPASLTVSSEVAKARGMALFALGDYREAVAELVDREIWLGDGGQILDNQRLIWERLAASAGAIGRLPPAEAGDPIVEGWLALAPLASMPQGGDEFRRGILEWRRAYVDHPAVGGLLADLLSDQRLAGTRPRQIALLLPLSTLQRNEALAVQDGFLAAHFASQYADDSQIRVYDTGQQGAANAYLNAQLEGADFIVGPLLGSEVEQVIAQAGFVPTLALNFSQAETPPLQSFYQFGLSPEDEAAAIARRAIAEGHRTAIAFHASNARGYRLLNAFRTEFESLGGLVLNSAGYVENADFAAMIQSLFNISQSEQRHRRLQANLSRNIGFEPRRRQDVDMIFLQTRAPVARLLAPQLRYHDAGDIPTFATSEVYEPGSPSAGADLDGVIFPDLPMLLEPDPQSVALMNELQSHWPQRARQWTRFYGLGFDAYALIGAVYVPMAGTWPISGMSGELDVDAQGRIHRTLPFAQFRRGQPVVLEPLPAPAYAVPQVFGRR
jgi:hypothetical protein